MVSGGFEVVPGELLNAARAYQTRADDVQQMLKQWEGTAKLDSSAFGNLAVSPKMAEEYGKFYDQVVQDTSKLSKTLQDGSDTLLLTAIRYSAVDRLIKLYMQFVQEVAQDNKYLDQADSGQGQ